MRITPSIFLVGDTDMGITEGGDSHVFLIRGQSGIFLVDAGGGDDNCESLLCSIESEGFNPTDITHVLITHHHRDHACGARALKDLLNCEIWIGENTGRHLLEESTERELGIIYAKEHGMYAKDYEYTHCPVDHGIEDGEEFTVAGINIRAINVTGHSDDSICFFMNLDGRKCLFNGDTFFFGGILGLLNYPMSSLEGYHKDMPKLRGLEVDALFPAHGLFCLKNGQDHIERTIKNLDNIFVPYNFGQIPYPMA